jgi:outer membrane receptor protein involved in Fe transport
MYYKLTIFLCACLTAISSFSQNGTLRGTVFDSETGEPIFLAQVQLEGTSYGITTDLDGKFSFTAPPGTYNMKVQFLGMAALTISDVNVVADEITLMGEIQMKSASETLKTFEVTAEATRRSESAMLTMKKKSVNVLDGISAQAISQSGDGDAAAAVTRVPGVSISDGKYVFVRGLGDRYTKTTLNGMDIPGLDPDRNSIQIDIFPTNIIENIAVLKSFTADLPADFTGGVVNIETKSFPEEPTLNVSLGLGFNPDMHFQEDAFSYDGGATDFLGFDDGTRDLPFTENTDIPNPAERDPRLTDLTRELSPTLQALNERSGMNYSFGISGGNQIQKEKHTLGVSAALSYKRNEDFFRNRQQNFFIKPDDLFDTELRADILQTGDVSVENVFVSAMLGGAIKTDRSKVTINLMHLQNGEDVAGYFDERQLVANVTEIFRDNLEYSQRSVSNAIIAGEHTLQDASWKIDWKVAPTLSLIRDKDVRVTPYRFDDGNFSIEPSESGDPTRIWRTLDEINIASRFDVSKEHELFGYNAKLKVGVGYVYKDRDYDIQQYILRVRRRGSFSFTGNADELLSDEFIYSAPDNRGTYVQGQFQPSNTYQGSQSTFALYVSEEFQITKKLKSIAGIRFEKYDQRYTGLNQEGSIDPESANALVFDNEKILDLSDFFPTLSLIYAVNDDMNLRGSFFRTTARPSFKEKSIAEIPDVLSGITFIGNIDVEQSYINNYDLRWETYFNRNQTVAVSAFYKQFDNPIELVAFSDAAPTNFQPRNVGDAEVFGLEFELRKNFDFISERLSNLALNLNVSVIESRVQYDRSPNGEFESRTNNLRTDDEGNPIEEIGNFRDMQGQAPYIVNAGLVYSDLEKAFTAGFYYNVQGRKLVIVGIGPNPDIYTVPFHSLNFNFMKSFGEDNKYQVGFGVDNILDDALEQESESFRSPNKIFTFLEPGRTFNLSFSYRIL